MSHPRIKDGITDEESQDCPAVLGQATYKYSPGSAQVLVGLDGSGVSISKSGIIQLPHDR